MNCSILAVFVCVIGYSKGMTRDERVYHIRSLITKCGATEEAPSSDVDLILNNKFPQTKQGKCIGACVGASTRMIKNKKIDVHGTIALAKNLYDGNAERMKLGGEIAKACAGVTDNERCKAALKIFECVKQQAKAKDFALDDISDVELHIP